MPALAEAAHLGRRDWTRRRRGDWTYAAEVQRPSIGCIVFTAGGLALSVSVLSLSSTAAPLVARLMLFVGSAVRPDGELALRLQRCGARPVCVVGVDDAQRAATQVVFDAAVVDAALLQSPDPQRLMRLRYALNCPLLVVADHADEVDEILALEQGADDYLARPVSARRFSARLTALARPPATCKPAAVDNMAVAGWRLDLATRRLHKAGRCVELPEMLATLLDRLVKPTAWSAASSCCRACAAWDRVPTHAG